MPAFLIPLAIAAATTAYQAYEADKQRGIATKKQAEDAQALADYVDELKKLGPGAEPPPINLQRFALLKEYIPEAADYYEQQAPELVTEADSGFEKGKQRQALEQLSGLSETGDDAISRAATEKAAFEADAAAKSRRAEVMRQMIQGGLGGSGQGILSGIAGQQQADSNQYLGGLQSAADAQKRRMDAISQLGSLSTNVRGQNFNAEQANKQIMNRFTENVANSKNVYNQKVAADRNEASRFNINQNQNIADKNIGLGNSEMVMNDERARAFEASKRGLAEKIAGLQYSGKTGNAAANAQIGQQDSANRAQMFGTLAQGVGAAAGAYGTEQTNKQTQENAVEDRKLQRELYGNPYYQNPNRK